MTKNNLSNKLIFMAKFVMFISDIANYILIYNLKKVDKDFSLPPFRFDCL